MNPTGKEQMAIKRRALDYPKTGYCMRCGISVAPQGRRLQNGDILCLDCYDRDRVKCTKCGQLVRVAETGINGRSKWKTRWCFDCFRKEGYAQCSDCGQYFQTRKLSDIEGHRLCYMCKKTLTYVCNDCERNIYIGHDAPPDDKICADCIHKNEYIKQWNETKFDNPSFINIGHAQLSSLSREGAEHFLISLVQKEQVDLIYIEQHKIVYVFTANTQKFPLNQAPLNHSKSKVKQLIRGELVDFYPIITGNKVIEEMDWGEGTVLSLWSCVYYFMLGDGEDELPLYLIGTLEPKDEAKRTKVEIEDATDLPTLQPIYVCNSPPQEHVHHTIKVSLYEVQTLRGGNAKIKVNTCIDCGYHFILYSALKAYQDVCGVILYPFVPSPEHRSGDFGDLNEYSRLRLLGYNVSQVEGLPRSARRRLLKTILGNGWMQFYEIIQHIQWLVNVSTNIPSRELAVRKWREDLLFLTTYNTKREAEGKGYLTKK